MEDFLTPEQAAEKLGMHARTIRRLLANGELPGRRLGSRKWFISIDALKAFLSTPQAPPTPQKPPRKPPVRAVTKRKRRAAGD